MGIDLSPLLRQFALQDLAGKESVDERSAATMQPDLSSTPVGHERTTFHSAAAGGFYGPDRRVRQLSVCFTGFKPGRGGSSPYSNLILDPSGDLYGITFAGGIKGQFCCGTIFKVTAAGTETVLYRFPGDNGDGFP
jgi:uncharacterized repeat protein (TIGR03803 family)